MSEQISSRHQSDLGGRFSPFGETDEVCTTVVVAPEAAHCARVQHSAWMLLNLLSRQQGVVSHVGLICPAGIPQAGRLIPLADRQIDLRAALIAGNQAIGVVPVVPDRAVGKLLVVGATKPMVSDCLHLTANGWCGGISAAATEIVGQESNLPFGPYIAACLAAGEVFKAARLKPGSYSSPESTFYSAWTRSPSASFDPAGPIQIERELDFALGGVGAVGCAFLHALDACPGVRGKGVLADNDKKGLEGSNLNRYALFGKNSIGLQKATEASRLLSDSPITFTPHDQPLEAIASLPGTVVSAVDTNPARAAIQLRYPAEILSASTHDLRAEVLRCGPPGIGACLRCYNAPEAAKSDQQIAQEIQAMSDDELATYARNVGVTVMEARQWAASQKCGMAGEAVLKHFRQTEPQAHGFAVGFVSVMAGTLLAAELVTGEPELARKANRSVVQFWSPAAATNRSSPYLRDPACPMCRPGSTAVRIWNERLKERRAS
ncbi:MAG: ThiF family adenylyltransferase [Candidatus Binatia bacterium]